MSCLPCSDPKTEEAEAAEAEDDYQARMHQLAEEALRKAELEEAKEFVLVDEEPNVPVNADKLVQPPPEDGGGRMSKMLRTKTFFVNHGVSIEDNLTKRGFESYGIHSVDDWRLRVQKATGAVFFNRGIPTADGRFLDGYSVPPRGLDNRACVILFHANAMICLDMALWAKWYSVRGFTAIAITMGGYADSSFVTTSELSTYFDAQAAVDHAVAETGLPLNRIIVHGLSIGGALASAAAAANPGLHCTVDQTFVNAQEIALSCAKEFSSRVPSWLVKASVSSMFSSGVSDPRLPGYLTDQYDNEHKASLIRGQYFVFWAFEDHMMLPDYAVRLFQAWSFKYEEDETQDGFDIVPSQQANNPSKRVAVINGTHCAFFGHDTAASKKYENYLQELLGIQLRSDQGNQKRR